MIVALGRGRAALVRARLLHPAAAGDHARLHAAPRRGRDGERAGSRAASPRWSRCWPWSGPSWAASTRSRTTPRSCWRRCPRPRARCDVALQDTRLAKPTAMTQVREAARELDKAAAAASGQAPPAPPAAAPPSLGRAPAGVRRRARRGDRLRRSGQALFVFLLTWFVLSEDDTFKRKLLKMVGPSFERKKITVRILDDIDRQVQRQMGAMFVVNLLIGVVHRRGLRPDGPRAGDAVGRAGRPAALHPLRRPGDRHRPSAPRRPTCSSARSGAALAVARRDPRPLVRDRHGAHDLHAEPRLARERDRALRGDPLLRLAVGRAGAWCSPRPSSPS